MDDMKLGMYLRAKARIASKETDFICWALLAELADNFNSRSGAGVIYIGGQGLVTGSDLNSLLEEFFPEFFDLFDGTFWPLGIPTNLEEVNPVTSPHEAWFDWADVERRQRLLDFLITHR